MIIELIIITFYKVLTFLTAWLPADRLDGGGFALPYGIDSLLVTAVSSFKAMFEIFPPFEVVFNAFLIYLGFRFVLRIVRMIPIIGRFVVE